MKCCLVKNVTQRTIIVQSTLKCRNQLTPKCVRHEAAAVATLLLSLKSDGHIFDQNLVDHSR